MLSNMHIIFNLALRAMENLVLFQALVFSAGLWGLTKCQIGADRKIKIVR